MTNVSVIFLAIFNIKHVFYVKRYSNGGWKNSPILGSKNFFVFTASCSVLSYCSLWIQDTKILEPCLSIPFCT